MRFKPVKEIGWVSHPDDATGKKNYYLHKLWGNDLAYATWLPMDEMWVVHIFSCPEYEGCMNEFRYLKEGKAWAESYLRLQGVNL